MQSKAWKNRAHFCVDHGHSNVVTVDWGRVFCARCDACLGDGLTQSLDTSQWVFCEPDFACYGCEKCQANYRALSNDDLRLLPRLHRSNLTRAFGKK